MLCRLGAWHFSRVSGVGVCSSTRFVCACVCVSPGRVRVCVRAFIVHERGRVSMCPWLAGVWRLAGGLPGLSAFSSIWPCLRDIKRMHCVWDEAFHRGYRSPSKVRGPPCRGLRRGAETRRTAPRHKVSLGGQTGTQPCRCDGSVAATEALLVFLLVRACAAAVRSVGGSKWLCKSSGSALLYT